MTVEFFDAVKSGEAATVREHLASDGTLALARDEDGATALHHAAEMGKREIVALLLDAGADLNARDARFHATPAGWAIEYLRMRGGLLAMEIEDLLLAIRERNVGGVRRMVTRLPALAGATDRSGKPLAQHARECGSEEIAHLFREHGAAAAGEPEDESA
jgi:ankyrin repeat protein